MKFFMPNGKKVFILLIFVFIAYAGGVQAWTFAKAGAKPFLYDLLAPIPFWVILMYLLLPLSALTAPFRLLGLNIFNSAWLMYPVSLAYFYVMSCALVWVYDALKTKLRRA